MTVLLAGPGLPGGPDPVYVQNRPLRLTLIGPDRTDEQTFHLNDPDSPVRMALGMGGLGMPTWTVPVSTSAARAGQRPRKSGATANPRDFILPFKVMMPTGQQWLAENRRFWESFDPLRESELVVGDPYSAATRTLRFRFVDDGAFAHKWDPAQQGWAIYPVHVVADDPFYVGDEVTKQYAKSTPQPFLTPGGGKYIGRSRQLGNASIANLGDEPAFYTATITGTAGGVTAWAVGVGGKQVGGPIAIADGETITVATAPGRLSVRRGDGTSVVTSLTLSAFTAIPPGDRVPLTFSITGHGKIEVTIRPRYRHALAL